MEHGKSARLNEQAKPRRETYPIDQQVEDGAAQCPQRHRALVEDIADVEATCTHKYVVSDWPHRPLDLQGN
jgi:hypothetical protein